MKLPAHHILVIATTLTAFACGTEPGAPFARSLENEYPTTRTDDASDASPDGTPDTAQDIAIVDLSIGPDLVDASDDGEVADPPGPTCNFIAWDDGLVGGSVAKVLFDPRVPNLVWATSNAGLMRSDDDGVTFVPRAAELGLGALAFPADDIKRILGLSSRGLVESRDSGVSFAPLALSGLGLTALGISPVQPTRVWLGTNGGGVLRSDSGGTAFTTANIGIPYGQVFAIAPSPDSPDVALVGMGYRNLANEIENRGVILRTSNAGRTWQIASEDVVWGNQIVFCPTDSTRAYAAVRRGILESFDGGITWERLPMLDTRDVLDVAFGAGGCDDLWATVYQDGIYHLDLGADTAVGPFRTGAGVEAARIQAQLAPHPTDPSILLTATSAGIFRSSDGGLSFTSVPGPATLNVTGLAGSLDGSGEVLLGTAGAGLWRRDGDSAWERVPELQRDMVYNVVSSPSDHTRFALATTSGSFVASAGPETLTVVTEFRNNFTHALWRDALGDQIFATQTGGVFRSTNGGTTVTAMNDGLVPWATPNGTFIDIRFVVTHPTVDGGLLAGTRGRGVAIWDPTEARWALVANSLATDEVYQLIVIGPYTFARVREKGVLWSADDGLTWQSFNTGLDATDLGGLVFDAPSDALYGLVDGQLMTVDLQHATDPALLRWRPLGRRCLPEDVRLQNIALVSHPDGGRDLILGANGNRVWRLPLATTP